METRRIHPSNAGRGSRLVAMGFEGAAIFWTAASAAVSIGCFLLFYGAFAWPFLLAVFVGGAPTLLTVILVATLVRGKPTGYLDEYVEWQSIRISQKAGFSRCRFFRVTTHPTPPFTHD